MTRQAFGLVLRHRLFIMHSANEVLGRRDNTRLGPWRH